MMNWRSCDSGEDPSAIAFAGDSAGGGHAVTTCLAARDAGLPVPAAIVAFSPGLDYTRSGATMSTKEGIDPIFTRDAMGRTGEMYLAGQDPRQPLLSPAILADLTGFPPILLQVGTNELLLDDSVRLAERARCGCRRDPRRHRRGAARVPGLRRDDRRGRPGTRPSSPVPHPAPQRSLTEQQRSTRQDRPPNHVLIGAPDKGTNVVMERPVPLNPDPMGSLAGLFVPLLHLPRHLAVMLTAVFSADDTASPIRRW